MQRWNSATSTPHQVTSKQNSGGKNICGGSVTAHSEVIF